MSHDSLPRGERVDKRYVDQRREDRLDLFREGREIEFLAYRDSGGLLHEFPVIARDEHGLTVQTSDSQVYVPEGEIGIEPWHYPWEVE